ncbi:hypothetical protein [uncultured Ruminococcus sp.]|uniref:hypothetical protein n=1 Tax=uncultured Ruminococcus sp. TaxID=165186 RepID=UPI0025EE6111|nr:hypothetical protein [uncultured Ruminococcus sp.]
MKVYNEKELGKALHDDVDSIEIEGDLSNKVIRIKATGKVAWGLLIGCMAIAIPLVIVTVATSGTATIVTSPALVGVMAPSIATLGVGATFSAVSIAAGATIAAGGVSKISAGVAGLGKLRQYKITKNGNGITLKMK